MAAGLTLRSGRLTSALQAGVDGGDVGILADRVALVGRRGGWSRLTRRGARRRRARLVAGCRDRRRVRRAGQLDLARRLGLLPGELLLVGTQLGEGDLADGQRYGGGLLAGEQGQQVIERHLLEQSHVVDGALGVAAEHEHAVVGQDVGVVAVAQLRLYAALQKRRARRRVPHDLDSRGPGSAPARRRAPGWACRSAPAHWRRAGACG